MAFKWTAACFQSSVRDSVQASHWKRFIATDKSLWSLIFIAGEKEPMPLALLTGHSSWTDIQMPSSSVWSCLLQDWLKCFCSRETRLKEANPCHRLCDSPCTFNWTNYSSHLFFREINHGVELLEQNGCHIPAWADGIQQWLIKLNAQTPLLKFTKKTKPYFTGLKYLNHFSSARTHEQCPMT